jgi:DnaJ-class molecular chaperone
MKGGETFYDVLGVDEKCSQDDIKKAYRKLSFINHPDKNGNSQESTEKFQKISEAFSILSDPDERVKYDITRNNPFAGMGGGFGGGGIRVNPMDIFNMFMGGGGGGGGAAEHHPMNGFVNMGGLGGFGGMPGMPGMPGGPRIIIRTFGPTPGGDGFNENMMGELNDILSGMGMGMGGMFNEPQIRVGAGAGGGHYHHPPPQPPPYQEMQQQQQQQQQHPHSHPDVQRTPRYQKRAEQKPALISVNITITLEQACQGATVPIEMERWNMNSEGTHELDKHTEYVTIPVGAESGEVIILSNRGNEGAPECRGDVKVTLTVEEHTTFKRNGMDIIMEKKITLKEALCGFAFEIEHLNGKKFAFNSSSGNIIRDGLIKTIPKLGIQRGTERGNLNVAFKVSYPEKLTEAQIKTLSEIL